MPKRQRPKTMLIRSLRNDDIKVIQRNRLVRICNVHILHIAFYVNLSLRENIANVFCDDRPFASKQLRHLRMAEPKRFTLHADVYFYRTIGGLIYYNFMFFVHSRPGVSHLFSRITQINSLFNWLDLR